jgi:hypothetical protein
MSSEHQEKRIQRYMRLPQQNLAKTSHGNVVDIMVPTVVCDMDYSYHSLELVVMAPFHESLLHTIEVIKIVLTIQLKLTYAEGMII